VASAAWACDTSLPEKSAAITKSPPTMRYPDVSDY
jgi:hypothetical protein